MVQPKIHNNNLQAKKDPKHLPKEHRKYRDFVEQQIKKYNLDCYISFTSDCHLSEYIGTEDQRVFFLTGFQGSNGIAVTCKEPCLITDPRYFLRAQSESFYPLFKGGLIDYIVQNKLKRISFNRRYISHSQYKSYVEKLAEETPESKFILTDEEEHVARSTTTLFSMENHDITDFINLPRKRRLCWCSKEENGIKPPFLEGECPCKFKTTAIESYLKSFDLKESTTHLSGISYQEKISKIQKILKKNKRVIIAELDIEFKSTGH